MSVTFYTMWVHLQCLTIFIVLGVSHSREVFETRLPYDPGLESDCPSPGDRFLSKFFYKPLWGVEGRALTSLPEELAIVPSSIKGAGFGVIAKTFIRPWTWLGDYEGEIIKKNKAPFGHLKYAWRLHKRRELTHFTDALNVDTSTFLRYVNCARHVREQNVEMAECKGKVFYLSTRGIAPGSELLVYYGDSYASTLGIDYENYQNKFIASPANNVYANVEFKNNCVYRFQESRQENMTSNQKLIDEATSLLRKLRSAQNAKHSKSKAFDVEKLSEEANAMMKKLRSFVETAK